MSERPYVELFALGGTIASLPRDGAEGVSPEVTADELVAAVPGLDGVAVVGATQVLQVPSTEVTPEDIVALVARMGAAIDAGVQGVVVTQGTDTLEESAFLLDLLWQRPEAVVVTGAMRTPDTAGADGPANLLAAVRVAASPQARDCGVLVCLGDRVHGARHVRKTHTSDPAAFTSPGYGPVGTVTEDRVTIAMRPARGSEKFSPAPGPLPKVGLVRVSMADDGQILAAVEGLDFQGLVVEGLGGGHVPARLVDSLSGLVDRMPVLLASRSGSGEVLRQTYGYPGGDVDLVDRGLVPVGDLDGAKARLLLQLALASEQDRHAVEELVRRVAGY